MNRDVALCISGQMRTYKKCYGYLQENIIEPLRPDIFIHTWEMSGATTKFNGSEVDQERITVQTLNRLYDPESARIESFQEEWLTKKGDVVFPEELQKQTDATGADIPLFYKMKKCNDLKSSYEDENGFKYDIVIKIRPDLIVSEEIPEEIISNPSILWHSGNSLVDPEIQVSDKFAISSSENMDYYTSVWDSLSDYWENPLGDGQWENIRVGERLMKHHMSQSNIQTEPFFINSDILRSREYMNGDHNTLVGKIWEYIYTYLPS